MAFIGNYIHQQQHGIRDNTVKLPHLTIDFGFWRVGAVKIVELYGIPKNRDK